MKKGVLWVQRIVGALLYYARSVNNKLILYLSEKGAWQASSTEKTLKVINHILDYCSTYADNGLVYFSSDTILTAHSNSGLNKETNSRSRADLSIWKRSHPLLEWAYFKYFTDYKICTVLGVRSRNGCFIINNKINGTSETHSPKWDGISLPHQFNLTTQKMSKW